MSVYCNYIHIVGNSPGEIRWLHNLIQTTQTEKDVQNSQEEQWLKEAISDGEIIASHISWANDSTGCIVESSSIPDTNESWHKIIKHFAPNCSFHGLVAKIDNDEDAFDYNKASEYIFIEEDKGFEQLYKDVSCRDFFMKQISDLLDSVLNTDAAKAFCLNLIEEKLNAKYTFLDFAARERYEYDRNTEKRCLLR
jgi:hypothetical protein